MEDPGYDHEGTGDVCGYVHPAQGRTEDAQVALLPDLCWGCRLSLGVQLVEDVVLMPNIRMLFRKNAICCGRKPALVLLSTVPWS